MDWSDPEAITWPFQLTEKLWRDNCPSYLDPTKPELSARGKNVVITGASGGIGGAIAEAWALAKADGILITGRNTTALDEVAKRLRAVSPETKVVVQAADLVQETSVAQFWALARKEFGEIHVLINDAGVMNFVPMVESEPATWWRDFEVNVKGVYLMDYHFLRQGGAKGTIITISTGAAGVVPGVPNHPPAMNMTSYVPAKLAQTKMSELLQTEHADLRTFIVLPGTVATGMTAKAFYPYAKDDPKLTAGMSLFLCTGRADWLKGQTISVNWDIEEMEAHKDEILSKNLLKLRYVAADLQKGGHPWKE